MESTAHLFTVVAASGFALAVVFGAVARRTEFCTMGAVSDIVTMGDWGRMRMWLLAIAVALIGANLLDISGFVDLSRSMYTAPRMNWLAHLVGGLIFGMGMTLASGCGMRNLVRLGGGNVKSLVVLVFLAMAAYMTMKGALAPLRTGVLEPASVFLEGGQDLSALLSRLSGVSRRSAQILVTLLLGGGLIAFVLSDRRFRRSADGWLAGVVIGFVVAAGWYVTGHLGYVAEDPDTLAEIFVGTNSKRPESFSYVGPVAYTLELLLLWTDKSLKLTFGVALVLGMVAGSLAYALAGKNFRWEGFGSIADVRNHVAGGLLMGLGGVTALGCTVGQGITGFSTLALGSILTFFSIIAGSVATLKLLEWRIARTG